MDSYHTQLECRPPTKLKPRLNPLENLDNHSGTINPQSSSEDISWSVISTPLSLTAGSQQALEDSEDNVILPSRIEEPLDDDQDVRHETQTSITDHPTQTSITGHPLSTQTSITDHPSSTSFYLRGLLSSSSKLFSRIARDSRPSESNHDASLEISSIKRQSQSEQSTATVLSYSSRSQSFDPLMQHQGLPPHASPASPYPNSIQPVYPAPYNPAASSLAHPDSAGHRGPYGDLPNTRDYAVASAAYTKGISDASRIQMMTVAQFAGRSPQQQPIIIQNTTKAVAESKTESKKTVESPKRSKFDNWAELLCNFWNSKINRLLLLGLAGAGLYLYWEWWNHRKRMQLMQRRIEANPLLRLGQIISGVADGQRSRNPSNGAYY